MSVTIRAGTGTVDLSVSRTGPQGPSGSGGAGEVPSTRTISTTSPLAGGGDLSANRTLSIPAATSAVAGHATAAQIAKLDGIEALADVTDAANVATALAAASAALSVNSQRITSLGTPTAAADAATKSYVDQPGSRVYAGAADTIVAADVGGVVFYTGAGAVTTNLPDLSASLVAGRLMMLTFQNEGAATLLTIDPGASVTIDGATSNVVGTAGRKRVSLFSRDGLAWFTGA